MTLTLQRTTKIWADTVRAELCRHPKCRRQIFFAHNVRTGNRSPYDNRPVPIAEQPELETGRLIWTIDLAQAASHFATCPGSAHFRRPR